MRTILLVSAAALLAAAGTAIAQRQPSLEQRVAALEAGNRKLSDVIEIQKLQSLYQHHMLRGDGLAIAALFADRPDVEIELSNKGIMRGSDAPYRYFLNATRATAPKQNTPRGPGALILHTSVNPVIEINGDGTRAKALWLSPGITTVSRPGIPPSPDWNYGKYEMEYVKQNGAWKILAFRWRQIFFADSTKGWVAANRDPGAANPNPDKPSAPGYYAPYDPAKTNPYDPAPPTPF